MAADAPDRWVHVASFLGFDGDVQADLLVTTLTGLGMPALRLPCLPTTALPMAAWPMIRAAVVLVPCDYEQDAREVVAEWSTPATRPELRAVLLWALGIMLVSTVANLCSGTAVGGEPRLPGPAAVAWAAGVVAVLMLVRASCLLAARLVREGRLRLDARPAVAAGLAYAVVSGVFSALSWLVHQCSGAAPPGPGW